MKIIKKNLKNLMIYWISKKMKLNYYITLIKNINKMFNEQKNRTTLLFIILCGIFNMLYHIHYYKINMNNFLINEILILYFNVLSNIFTGSIIGICIIFMFEKF
jgi:hypothetical protein